MKNVQSDNIDPVTLKNTLEWDFLKKSMGTVSTHDVLAGFTRLQGTVLQTLQMYVDLISSFLSFLISNLDIFFSCTNKTSKSNICCVPVFISVLYRRELKVNTL